MSEYTERYWRDATPEDAIAEPPMVARFKTDSIWAIDEIIGFRKSEIHKWLWYSSKGELWTCCQVYDAPDPGEGYRLIEPDQDHYNQSGIEYWNRGAKLWLPRDQGHDMTSFCSGAFYRIRIEPPKPKYVPFEWEDREELKSRWIRYSSKGQTVVEVCVKFTNDEDGFLINDTYNYWLLDNATFFDTGEPVGKKVQ